MKTFLFAIAFSFSIFNAFATETKIIVRAKAKDAKFIGNSIGGAYVIIRNTIDQSILAEGKTTGNTGNTDLIMKMPHERGKQISDEETAKFLAILNIDEPTFISIEVYSSLSNKQSRAKVTTELWVIPGKHILGDGIIVEIPGFMIDILKPQTHQSVSLASLKNNEVAIKANIVMMCGCPIQKDGLWNSEDMEVKGILRKDGQYVNTIELKWTETNVFEGNAVINITGNYELTVYAYNAKTGNTGVDVVNYIISK